MRDHSPKEGSQGLIVRWSPLVLALALGGLVLAARAEDEFTAIFGMLLTAFGVLIGFRLVVRAVP